MSRRIGQILSRYTCHCPLPITKVSYQEVDAGGGCRVKKVNF